MCQSSNIFLKTYNTCSVDKEIFCLHFWTYGTVLVEVLFGWVHCSIYSICTRFFTTFLDAVIKICQAGSFRGDAYATKLRQLEQLSALLIRRTESRQIERVKFEGDVDFSDSECCICYACEADAQFVPCSHTSCFGCISRHLLNCERCFFCNATVLEVVRTGLRKAWKMWLIFSPYYLSPFVELLGDQAMVGV